MPPPGALIDRLYNDLQVNNLGRTSAGCGTPCDQCSRRSEQKGSEQKGTFLFTVFNGNTK